MGLKNQPKQLLLTPENWVANSKAIVASLREQNQPLVRVIGSDGPLELIHAHGIVPIRLVANPALVTPNTDALIGTASLSQRGHSLLEQIITDGYCSPLLFTHSDCEQAQIFAALRELYRTQVLPFRPTFFLDLLHQPRKTSANYNQVRLQQLSTWLAELSGQALTQEHWHRGCEEMRRRVDFLRVAQRLRDQQEPVVSGHGFLELIACTQLLPPNLWHEFSERETRRWQDQPVITGNRILATGSAQTHSEHWQALEEHGCHIVGDYQNWGDAQLVVAKGELPWLQQLAEPNRKRPDKFIPARDRVKYLAENAHLKNANQVIWHVDINDEASGWDGEIGTRLLREQGISAWVWYSNQSVTAIWENTQNSDKGAEQPENKTAVKPANNARKIVSKSRRSKKSLQSIARLNDYQKQWFQGVHATVDEGASFGVVNANSPQEMLRALGLPFVVNQWWASIVAAKQQSKRYFKLLTSHSYPANVESYSAQGLAALFDDDDELAPWGGLPTPDFVQCVNSTDATPRIYDHWAAESGAHEFQFERTVDCRLDLRPDWWQSLPEHWDTELETERLDLMTAELRLAITELEKISGNPFDEAAFIRIMNLVNEQEEYYRKTRDLIAQTSPAPVCLADTMPATMVPQWHRGTEWARDSAKAFYLEVKQRVDNNLSVCPNEKLRLMWVGRGMWSDMGFYQRWHDSHGAVFVWSMYLSLAADGYIRYFDNGRDPLRALAARFVTMGDELRMPTWAGAWHVHEAKTHGVHGAIALTDADPFVLRALKNVGVPVLSLNLDNYNQETDDEAEYCRSIELFLNKLLTANTSD